MITHLIELLPMPGLLHTTTRGILLGRCLFQNETYKPDPAGIYLGIQRCLRDVKSFAGDQALIAVRHRERSDIIKWRWRPADQEVIERIAVMAEYWYPACFHREIPAQTRVESFSGTAAL
jgi:hypothetical protein